MAFIQRVSFLLAVDAWICHRRLDVESSRPLDPETHTPWADGSAHTLRAVLTKISDSHVSSSGHGFALSQLQEKEQPVPPPPDEDDYIEGEEEEDEDIGGPAPFAARSNLRPASTSSVSSTSSTGSARSTSSTSSTGSIRSTSSAGSRPSTALAGRGGGGAGVSGFTKEAYGNPATEGFMRYMDRKVGKDTADGGIFQWGMKDMQDQFQNHFRKILTQSHNQIMVSKENAMDWLQKQRDLHKSGHKFFWKVGEAMEQSKEDNEAIRHALQDHFTWMGDSKNRDAWDDEDADD